jgi:hypothetical protein
MTVRTRWLSSFTHNGMTQFILCYLKMIAQISCVTLRIAERRLHHAEGGQSPCSYIPLAVATHRSMPPSTYAPKLKSLQSSAV